MPMAFNRGFNDGNQALSGSFAVLMFRSPGSTFQFARSQATSPTAITLSMIVLITS